MNKKNIYGLLSLLLTVVMLLTILPIQTDAAQNTATDNTELTEMFSGYQAPTCIDMGYAATPRMLTGGVGTTTYGASEWDTYSSDYFYRQMTTAQKSFYDALYTECMKYLLGSANVNLMSAGYGTDYIPIGSLTQSQATNVAVLFQTNNPQFYYINDILYSAYNYYGNYFALGIYADFASGTTRAGYTNQIQSRIRSWVTTIESQSDIVAMEQKAHDLVISNTVYREGSYHQSAAGVFLEGEAVCAGYAEAYELLCNAVGLETIAVTSSIHEWNKTKLYGRWYAVDCTWDDKNGIIYNYFNTSDAALQAVGMHTLENFWSGFNVPDAMFDTVITTPVNSSAYSGVDYSAVFDADYYLNNYSDLRAVFGADTQSALAHFVNYGMAEGRQGTVSFNVYSYKAQNKDLRMAFGNDLKSYYMHYMNNGRNEGRTAVGNTTITDGISVYNGVDYSAVYNYSYYIANNLDIARAFPNDDISTLAHFVNCGMNEGRQGIASFNVRSYRAQYADLRMAFGNDLKSYYLHYMNNGRIEGRVATGTTKITYGITVYNGVDYSTVYNYSYYINHNLDIASAFPNDDISTLAHFVNCGMNEGRIAADNFALSVYAGKYADLRNAFGSNWKSYYMHYITTGRDEGRVAK